MGQKKGSDAFLQRTKQLSDQLHDLTWGDLETKPDGSGRLTSLPTPDKQFLTPETVQALEAIRPIPSHNDNRNQRIFGFEASEMVGRLAAAYETTINRVIQALTQDAQLSPEQFHGMTWKDLETKPDGSGRLFISEASTEVYLTSETVQLLDALKALKTLRAYSAEVNDHVFDLPSEQIATRATIDEWKVDASKPGWAYWGKLGNSNFEVIQTRHTEDKHLSHK